MSYYLLLLNGLQFFLCNHLLSLFLLKMRISSTLTCAICTILVKFIAFLGLVFNYFCAYCIVEFYLLYVNNFSTLIFFLSDSFLLLSNDTIVSLDQIHSKSSGIEYSLIKIAFLFPTSLHQS